MKCYITNDQRVGIRCIAKNRRPTEVALMVAVVDLCADTTVPEPEFAEAVRTLRHAMTYLRQSRKGWKAGHK
jgi:hypothetical protein